MDDLTALLEEVKNYLNYTWEDANRDTRLVGYIKSSLDYLNGVAGTELDIKTNFLAKELLLNRVLYMNSQALDDFQNNYSGMLNELKIQHINYDDQKE